MLFYIFVSRQFNTWKRTNIHLPFTNTVVYKYNNENTIAANMQAKKQPVNG